MFQKIALVLIFSILFLQNISFAQSNYQIFDYSKQAEDSLSGYALFVPAGITTRVILSQEINSNSTITGQSINAIMSDDFYYNDSLIAPKGSIVEGSVVQVSKAKYGDINAKILIKFTTITTPYGNVVPISAVVLTSDNTGVLRGGAKLDSIKEYAKNTAVGAGSGAVAGTIAGAISSKSSVGKGAIYGSAIGAGMGLIKGAANKGRDVVIPANSEIDIYFNQPITLGGK